MSADQFFNEGALPQLVLAPHDDVLIEANLEACRLFRLDREQLRARRPSQLFGRTFHNLIVFTQELLENRRGWTDTLEIDVDHRARQLEVIGRASNTSGTWLVYLGLQFAREMEDRRQLADATRLYRSGIGHWTRVASVFREFERENRLLLDAAGEGIYGVDRNGNTTFVNPAAQRILGYSAEELAGRNMHTMVHHSHSDGSHFELGHCPIFAALKDGEVHTVDDDVFWDCHGKPVDVEYTSTPIEENGEIVGVVVVFRDVSQKKSDRRRLLAALEEVQVLKNRLELENAYLQEEISSEYNHHRIIGRSAGVQNTIRQVKMVAPTDATVLIYGESGTGKELIARAIHESSQRSERPLIRVNCAAVPEDLFESEFFGHVRGAFTGATGDRPGRFELADGGTLFLDEVGEIPLHLQGKLLRVLQEQQFERVGDATTRSVNVRVVAATNRDLRKLVDRGEFREDLYFRLNVFPIHSVPLRERKEDIPMLAQLFLDKATKKAHKPNLKMPLGELEKLSRYHWPGNIRELENVIERQVILAQGDSIRVGNLDTSDSGRSSEPASPMHGDIEQEEDLQRRQRRNILMALESTGGKVFGPGGAAELLGVKPTTLASRIKRFRIDTRQFKERAE